MRPQGSGPPTRRDLSPTPWPWRCCCWGQVTEKDGVSLISTCLMANGRELQGQLARGEEFSANRPGAGFSR